MLLPDTFVYTQFPSLSLVCLMFSFLERLCERCEASDCFHLIWHPLDQLFNMSPELWLLLQSSVGIPDVNHYTVQTVCPQAHLKHFFQTTEHALFDFPSTRCNALDQCHSWIECCKKTCSYWQDNKFVEWESLNDWPVVDAYHYQCPDLGPQQISWPRPDSNKALN